MKRSEMRTIRLAGRGFCHRSSKPTTSGRLGTRTKPPAMFKLKGLSSTRTSQAGENDASSIKPAQAQSRPEPSRDPRLGVASSLPSRRAGAAGTPSAPRVGLERLLQPRPKPSLRPNAESTIADLPAPDSHARHNTLAARPIGDGAVELRWSHKSRVPPEETRLAQQEVAKLIQNTDARFKPLPADVARVPTECVAAWLDHLGQKEAGHTAASPQAELIQELKASARMAWMKHQLGVEATRSSLLAAASKCDAAGLDDLGRTARALAAELASHGPEGPPLCRLHDNLNGRVWESALFAELAQHTPQPVLQATRQLCSYVANQLDQVPPIERPLLHRAISKALAEHRPWSHARPLAQYLKFGANDTEFTRLRAMLLSPPRDGMDCIAQVWLAQRVTLQLIPNSVVGNWSRHANQNYADHVYPAKSVAGAPAGNTTVASGITMRHQPPAVRLPGSLPAERPAVVNQLQVESISPASRAQLNQGAPLSGSVSGSTNLMWHLMRHAELNEGKHIDVQNAMLGVFMMLNQDGGHSLHEGLWILDQIAWRGQNPPSFGVGAPHEYVVDYDAYFNSFTHPEVKAAVQHSCEAAWNALGDYRRRHLPERG